MDFKRLNNMIINPDEYSLIHENCKVHDLFIPKQCIETLSHSDDGILLMALNEE